ncbi:box C/D snoRNA protein 1 [Silurus meridionalis]|nr:box C/D snoRNA protein 1 [Silurus meridionalis]
MCDATALSPNDTSTGTNTGASQDERRGRKRKISLSSCDVCEAEEAKYRCPNCLKCSCSLSCVKQHKLRSECSGVRDRTAFVPLDHFSDLHLLNDYRFLEETGRVADKPNRDTLLHTRSRHSYCAMLLLRNAKAAKVNLKILPKSFSRRRENTSIYNKISAGFLLSEDMNSNIHFLKGAKGESGVILERPVIRFSESAGTLAPERWRCLVPEDRVLEKILSNYIDPTESDPVKRQNLKTYVHTPSDQLSVYMKSEQRLPNSLKYHELDLKKSLRENLMFKAVVEYPELHVVLKQHREEYLTRVPDRSIVSPHLSSSSKAQGAPERRAEKKPTPQSEMEEGEIQSEDEEEKAKEDDENASRNVSCAIDDDDDDDKGGRS